MSLVESKDNHTYLNMKEQPNRLIKAAFKFIEFKDIRLVDFSSTGFHDENMRQLASYLQKNPNLRSIYLDDNIFTDDGMKSICRELADNTKLAQISIMGCQNVNEEGLNYLNNVISKENTVLFQIDLDFETFDKEIAQNIIDESALNRDI